MKFDGLPSVQLDYQSVRQLYMFLYAQGNSLEPGMLRVFEILQRYMFSHHSIQELEQLTTAIPQEKNYL